MNFFSTTFDLEGDQINLSNYCRPPDPFTSPICPNLSQLSPKPTLSWSVALAGVLLQNPTGKSQVTNILSETRYKLTRLTLYLNISEILLKSSISTEILPSFGEIFSGELAICDLRPNLVKISRSPASFGGDLTISVQIWPRSCDLRQDRKKI